MVYTAYIIEKYTHTYRALIYMKSFELEEDAYLNLGLELYNYDKGIFEWADGDEGPFENLVQTEGYELKIASDWELMKKFLEYFYEMQRWGTSEEPFIHYGVTTT